MILTLLAANEVQLRLATFPPPGSPSPYYQQLLSPDELERGERLLNDQIRERFLFARFFLRQSLAGYLGLTPAALRFLYSEHGKPSLAAPTSLRFNLAHSGDLLLLACSCDREVGVDLEEVNQDLSYQPMARRYFAKQEQEQLFALPVAEQPAAFYRCWTRKEAFLKATGSGFTQPTDSFAVSFLPGQPPALLQHRFDPSALYSWRLADLSVPDGYTAALAIAGDAPITLVYR